MISIYNFILISAALQQKQKRDCSDCHCLWTLQTLMGSCPISDNEVIYATVHTEKGKRAPTGPQDCEENAKTQMIVDHCKFHESEAGMKRKAREIKQDKDERRYLVLMWEDGFMQWGVSIDDKCCATIFFWQ